MNTWFMLLIIFFIAIMVFMDSQKNHEHHGELLVDDFGPCHSSLGPAAELQRIFLEAEEAGVRGEVFPREIESSCFNAFFMDYWLMMVNDLIPIVITSWLNLVNG